VVFCALLALFTLPGEMILLRALAVPDSQTAVQQWASALPVGSLETAAGDIEQYSFMYRKAIMKALTPDQRARAWRGHITRYELAHLQLDADALALLEAAKALITPAAVSAPTDDIRAAVLSLADQITAKLGRSAAEELLYALGPRDGTFSTIEPYTLRITNYVRDTFVAFASDPDCNCNMFWGCYDYGLHCTDQLRCNIDDSWPMCGFLWDQVCNGMCASGMN
jgi:hypothetical protein